MALDLSSLRKAVGSLGKAVDVATAAGQSDRFGEVEREVLRAGVIQNFEFTYELCWKFMRRWLELSVGATYVAGVSRRELFRMAGEQNLIDDVERWFDYHQARNETSHTYDSERALEVFRKATEFRLDAARFLAALETLNDRS